MDKYVIMWNQLGGDFQKSTLTGNITEVKINERKRIARFYEDDTLIAWFTEVLAVVKVRADEASSAE